MTTRAPAAPPALRGYRYQKPLGSGGFADVFMYQQEMPRRSVAVKVLLPGAVSDVSRSRFTVEANLMAQVSTHPAIVSVYHADVAEDGRPFLVMEYCPKPNLLVRCRAERISVTEALRVGVRVAGAVETAHRSGILHRDIKPANVLTTEYGWPALTDFGISASVGQGEPAAEGMSVPWSPPEVFAEPPVSDVRSDVYSLGATVYTLLAGRAPFEVAGRNRVDEVIDRIERLPVPPTGRDDVPEALERVLARSMAKRPSSRYQSAWELARALQQVELELQLPPTTIDVLAAEADVLDDAASQDDGLTRIRSLVTITPDAPRPPPHELPVEGTLLRRVPVQPVPEPPALADTQLRSLPPAAAEPVADSRSGRRPLLLIGSGLLVAAVGAAAVALTVSGSGADEQSAGDVVPAADGTELDDALVELVPAPTDLVGSAQGGEVVFTWANPDPEEGDSYSWRRTDRAADPSRQSTTALRAAVPGAGPVCIEVQLVRANGRYSEPGTEGCSP